MSYQASNIVPVWAEIVWASLEGKYSGATFEQVFTLVRNMYEELRDSRISDCVGNFSVRPTNLIYDVRNQIATLALIEEARTSEHFAREPLVFLQKCLKGPDGGEARRNRYVEDYGGAPPTPTTEAEFRFDEIQRLVVLLAADGAKIDRRTRFEFLAHVFSSIIRIHYFDDGNGRTARMAVQYLARSWLHPYVAIPKVRNDPVWKQAVIEAVDGNHSRLRDEMMSREIK